MACTCILNVAFITPTFIAWKPINRYFYMLTLKYYMIFQFNRITKTIMLKKPQHVTVHINADIFE